MMLERIAAVSNEFDVGFEIVLDSSLDGFLY
jgi:hypothetical protein